MSTLASAGAPSVRKRLSLVGSRSLTSTTGAGARPTVASPAAAFPPGQPRAGRRAR
jgi:hypothetical protein